MAGVRSDGKAADSSVTSNSTMLRATHKLWYLITISQVPRRCEEGRQRTASSRSTALYAKQLALAGHPDVPRSSGNASASVSLSCTTNPASKPVTVLFRREANSCFIVVLK